MPTALSSGMKYLHDHATTPRNLKFVNRAENILLCTKDPSLDIVIVNFGMCIPWTTFSSEIGLVCMSFDLAVPNISIPVWKISHPSQEVLDKVAPDVLSQKGHGRPADLW